MVWAFLDGLSLDSVSVKWDSTSCVLTLAITEELSLNTGETRGPFDSKGSLGAARVPVVWLLFCR